MCGIAGIVRGSGRPVDAGALAAMADALGHRGPDGRGARVLPGAGMAHARLAIVDPAHGAQPVSTEDGRWTLVYNGEVYGHDALRRELEGRGHRFRTRCDTEVVLRGWAEWGADLLERLNGQFAFAAWDRDGRELHLARDRFGIRPLYLAERGGDLFFASEPAALFASGEVEAAPDPAGLAETFAFWGPRAPRTVFRGVEQLPPGAVGRWRGGRLRVRRWHVPSYPRAGQPDDVDARRAVEELDEALRDAVRIRLRADVPVGAYLSGGLDSTIVCHLACTGAAHPLSTFSVTFTGDAALDEGPFQREVAAALGTVHHAREVSAAEVVRALPRAVRHAAMPLVRTAPAPLMLLAATARAAGIKVVLSGEGADELFHGYDLFREDAVRRFCLRRPGSAARERLLDRLYPYVGGARGPFWRRAFLRAGDAGDPLFSHLPRFGMAAHLAGLLTGDARAVLDAHDPLGALRGDLPGAWAAWAAGDRAAYLELTTLLEPYLLAAQGDRMSMAHGVEARYPFLDPRVAALAARLPLRHKRTGLREKVVLRRWAAGQVPGAVLARPKQPYRAPGVDAFFAPRAPAWVAEALEPAALRDAGWWEPAAVAALARRAREGRVRGAREAQALVAVLTTQLWHRAHFGAGRGAAPLLHPLSKPANQPATGAAA